MKCCIWLLKYVFCVTCLLAGKTEETSSPSIEEKKQRKKKEWYSYTVSTNICHVLCIIHMQQHIVCMNSYGWRGLFPEGFDSRVQWFEENSSAAVLYILDISSVMYDSGLSVLTRFLSSLPFPSPLSQHYVKCL